MVFSITGNGQWMLQSGSVKYYVFLCKAGRAVLYALHRVINDNYHRDAINTIGVYGSLDDAKSAAEDDLLDLIA